MCVETIFLYRRRSNVTHAQDIDTEMFQSLRPTDSSTFEGRFVVSHEQPVASSWTQLSSTRRTSLHAHQVVTSLPQIWCDRSLPKFTNRNRRHLSWLRLGKTTYYHVGRTTYCTRNSRRLFVFSFLSPARPSLSARTRRCSRRPSRRATSQPEDRCKPSPSRSLAA